MKDPATPERTRFDPDPIVLDLLIGLATTAIAGAIKKTGQLLLNRRHQHQLGSVARAADEIGRLRRDLDQLDERIDEAIALVHPGSKRELGGQILLDRESLRRYHDLRDGLFEQVRSVDGLAETLLEDVDQPAAVAGALRLPQEFRVQLRFVEQRLRGAATASLSEKAFLENKAAVVAMRRMLDYIAAMSSR